MQAVTALSGIHAGGFALGDVPKGLEDKIYWVINYIMFSSVL